ncbi:unnamed protein product, partial [Rotaria sp. Silwood2]
MQDCNFDGSDHATTVNLNLTCNSSLHSLTLTDCALYPRKIESMVSVIPSIIALKLVSEHKEQKDSIVDGQYWEKMISSIIPSLEKFEFFFIISIRESAKNSSLQSLITPFKTQFWKKDKHWFVNCAFISSYQGIWLYTMPISEIRDTYWARWELSTMDDVSRITKRSIHDRIDPTKGE